MKQKEIAAVLAGAMLLAGCGGTQMGTMPEETPASGASPAAEPRDDAASDSAAETGEAAAPEQHTISLEQWRTQMSGQVADYTIEGPHAATSRLEDLAVLPEDGVTLQVMWWGGNGTLADAAETYGMTLEELQRLNPDVSDADLMDDSKGIYYYVTLLLKDGLYQLPETQTQTVTITVPWVQNRNDNVSSYEITAALDEQAAAAMAEAYSFLAHMNICCGYGPSEPVGEKENLYRAVEGARFTNYTDFTSYLNAVFSPELAESYANSARYDEKMNIYAGGYMQGENDELWFTGGERGTNILYCGTTFTEPELQSDGSLTFWQLSLQADYDSFEGWTQPVKVAQAEVTPVRLVPTENGWRVDKLELPL